MRRVEVTPEPITATFDDGGTTVTYSRMGLPSRRAYVLVHGIGMGRAVFARLAAGLRHSGTVYALDLPGFGDSICPEDAWTMADFGDLVAHFIEEVVKAGPSGGVGAEDIVLIGHSMGTEVAVECEVRHPGLLGALVLIAPTVNLDERRAWRQIFRMMQDLYDESPRVLANGLIQYLKANTLWFFTSLGVMMDHKVEDLLPQISTPTLVMRGSEDWVCPRTWVEEVARSIPGAQYTEAPGRGHEAMIRSASPVLELLESFLPKGIDAVS
ncbi:MAG: alpha/beta hydrolase [Ancrocorticia sp.]